jgi:hypothetical protein
MPRLKKDQVARKLAEATWTAARKQDAHHEDLVSCCAMILVEVAGQTGEDVQYLLSEVRRRLRPNDKDQAQNGRA